MPELDTGAIRYALEAARSRGVRRVRLKQGDAEFVALLPPAPKRKPALAGVRAVVESEEPEREVDVKAPVVGYLRAQAGLEVGARVEAGQVVAEVLALGLANDVQSPVGGEVVAVHAADGAPLQYGQLILTVRGDQ